MPWRECSVMDERVRFIGRLLDGEGMSELCREFGISRKTGYKIFNRYRQEGVEALTDRSRRPVRYANQLARPGGGHDRAAEAGEAALGRTQDPRAAGAAPQRRCTGAGQKHRARSARPARPGEARPSKAALHRQGHGPVGSDHSQRSLVCRSPPSEAALKASSSSATAGTVTP